MVIIFFCTGVFCRLSEHYIIILSSRLEDAQKANNLSQRVRAHSCCIVFPSPPFPLRIRSKCHNQYVLHLDSYTPLFINKVIRKKTNKNETIFNFKISAILSFSPFFFVRRADLRRGSLFTDYTTDRRKKNIYIYKFIYST